MLEKPILADFAKCLNQVFALRLESSTLEFELITAAELGSGESGDGRRQPFSLVFRGPKEPVLPQLIYPLENVTMGTLDMFLVPIGPDEAGMRYQAVFA